MYDRKKFRSAQNVTDVSFFVVNLSFTREGLTTPLTHRVASICSLCEGTIYIVLLGSTGSVTLVS